MLRSWGDAPCTATHQLASCHGLEPRAGPASRPLRPLPASKPRLRSPASEPLHCLHSADNHPSAIIRKSSPIRSNLLIITFEISFLNHKKIKKK
ncbi:hypothetical protein O181_124772 [Austropuccinia psidii MF-1]|uniref:Uncharacterized protein n=1 Tax=Austropuccinia psidii MF-1 TaxID=1389203 RepID=A0A9Q3KQ90_9BASI|nr:hypothetical protein [Austropuccinia psidii MF-1]